MRTGDGVVRLVVALVLLNGAAVLQAAGKEEIVRFESRVSRGETFRKPIGHGLALVLGGSDGWTISVAPEKAPQDKECTDFAWVVNPPFRNFNALYIFPSYGLTAQDVVDDSPREFNFVLSCAGYKRESTFVTRMIMSSPAGMQPSEKQVAEAEAKLGTSPQGHGKLWILDSKVSPAPEEIDGKNY